MAAALLVARAEMTRAASARARAVAIGMASGVGAFLGTLLIVIAAID